MMNKDQIVEALNEFRLSYDVSLSEIQVVAGSALVLHGLRESASDIDLFVTPETCKRLLESDRFKKSDSRLGPESLRLVDEVLDIGELSYPCVVLDNGYSVQTLESLLKLKLEMNREKDQVDIERLKSVLEKD
jgi:hypothetical protein